MEYEKYRKIMAGIRKDTLGDVLFSISELYRKILKINLTNDTFIEIKVEEKEREQFTNHITKISEWWASFEKAGNVYEEDLDIYREFTNIEQLKKYFRTNKKRTSCRYRRRAGDDFRWAQMELVASNEYTDENQELVLYVKDIHEEYMEELDAREKILDTYNRDALTFLFNRHKYNEDLEQLQRGVAAHLTCLYIDVNGLHELNNKLGHEKGDDMLCSVANALRRFFPDERVYRIGGDEFVVLSVRLSKGSVENIVKEVRKELWKDNYEISVGIASGKRELPAYKVVGAAELAMRNDKEQYYKRKGDRRKNRAINEQVEKMLTEKQDAEDFLKVIADRFAGVYFVNMEKDSVRHIYIPQYFQNLLEKTDYCYSEALRLYMERYVKWDYQEKFAKLFDYDYLEKMLAEKERLSMRYEKLDGKWLTLTILSLDTPRETIWIFADEGEHMF